MFGTIVNTSAILIGTVVGTMLNRGIEERYKESTMQGMGMVAIAIGIANISEGMKLIINPVIFILAIAIGSLAGEWINLEGKIEKLNIKFGEKKSPVQGIITGSLLFCVGAMSIMGPIKSALLGDNTLLYANSVLDGVTSIILSINYGISIGIVAIILFFWQGSIYLGAIASQEIFSQEILSQLTLLGGIFVLATGINILGIIKIKTLNILPALFIPFIAKSLGLM